MKRTKLELLSLSAILFATMCTGLRGQAILDTVAIRQLVAYYPLHADSLTGCAAGHYVDTIPVIDSVPVLAKECGPSFGVFGFVSEDFPYSDQQIYQGLLQFLDMRPELQFVGLVHGVVPYQLPDGRVIPAPLLWYVYRKVRPRPVESRPGDGP